MANLKTAALEFIITPKTRGDILRALKARSAWKGCRFGVKLAFQMLNPSPKNKAPRVRWWAQFNGRQLDGRDFTVYDAAQSIEGEIRKMQIERTKY